MASWYSADEILLKILGSPPDDLTQNFQHQQSSIWTTKPPIQLPESNGEMYEAFSQDNE